MLFLYHGTIPSNRCHFFKDWIVNLKAIVFSRNMQCILSRCSTPLEEAQLSFMFEGNTISLNIGNAPFKETQLPSIWTGTPFIWRKGFTHHKENGIFPKASHLKGKLHIPKEYLRMFSIQYFFDSGVWRMHLIDTWCLRGQMNQIWLGLIWINLA